MHIYIDANVFVTFFETSQDALIELEKLAVLLRTHAATLWLPEQTKREFWKNREKGIKKLIEEFSNHNLLGKAPLLVKEDINYKKLKESAAALEKERADIVKRIKEQLFIQETLADKMIKELFDLSETINSELDEIFSKAHKRALCHLPPGKSEDIGDRLAWESLLVALPQGADLHLITDDGDYESDLSPGQPNPYLKSEWKENKNGEVFLWKRISQFIADKFPDAATTIDLERSLQAETLYRSPNFVTTHFTISELGKYREFSDTQCRRITEALIENSQVRWIKDDKDINEFFTNFLATFKDQIEADLLQQAESILAVEQS
jgi:hypothetical protein